MRYYSALCRARMGGSRRQPAGPKPATASILCLHGGRQSAELFRQRIDRLRARCQAEGIRLIFVDAPMLQPDGSRCWYDEDGGDAAGAASAATIAVREEWERHAPVSGLLGFSQGAAVAAATALCSGGDDAPLPGLRFVILAGSPHEPLPVATGHRSRLPSLHLLSAADSAVPAHSSEAVAARFEEAQVYRHDKGHALPCRAGDVDALLGFIMRHLTPAAAATAPRPDQPSAGARADARAAGARPGAEAGAEGAEAGAGAGAGAASRSKAPRSSSGGGGGGGGSGGGAGGALLSERAAQLAAWCEELEAAEAIFGPDFALDEDSLDGEALQAAAAEASAAAAADPEGRAGPAPPVRFSVRLTGDSGTRARRSSPLRV